MTTLSESQTTEREIQEQIKQATLNEQLSEVDKQINKLAVKRLMIQDQLINLNIKSRMRMLARDFAEKLKKGQEMSPEDASLYTNTIVLPWRHRLPPLSFETTWNVINQASPPTINFTSTDQQHEFFERLETALAKDLDALV